MKLVVVVMFLLLAIPCSAQVIMAVHHNPAKVVAGHVWHYTTTHKEVIAQSLLFDLALAADAASSIRCQSYKGCIETDPLLGQHPSPADTWHWAETGGGIMTVSLFTFHWATTDQGNDRFERHLWWVPIGVFDGLEVENVWSNVHIDQSLSNQQSTAQWLRSAGVRK